MRAPAHLTATGGSLAASPPRTLRNGTDVAQLRSATPDPNHLASPVIDVTGITCVLRHAR